jgi:uncharacterized protein
MKIKCPMCSTQLEVSDDFELRPFCSPRCKKIDLANWLEGNYRFPRELLPEDLEQLPEDQRDEVIAAAMGEAVKRNLH